MENKQTAMTPKEKAKELVDKFTQTNGNAFFAKECALIAVDEIIKLNVFDCNDEWSDEDGDTREYWKQVKQEIEKL
jgi:hypothetical protein